PTQQMPLYENSTITARVTPTASCNTTSNSLTLNGVYPDKYTGATAATVRSFEAYATGHGVELRWETGAETGTLGFILHRDSPTGPRVNRELVHGLLTSPIGRGYAFQDPAGNGSTRYFLEEVATEGRHLFGPAKN